MRRFSKNLAVLGCLALVLVGASTSLRAQVVSSLEYGNTSGEPGEVVEVPVHVSIDTPIVAMALYFEYDPEVLDFLSYEIEGSAAAGAHPLFVFDSELRSGNRAVFGISPSRNDQQHFRIPSGDRVLLGHLRFGR